MRFRVPGFAGFVGFVFVVACGRPPAETPKVENVLLITVDTLRADRVGAYGYARGSTPALDSIAKNGVRFDRAFAAAPITQTSHATLLTGLDPQGHGARHNGMRIADSVPTLAQQFKSAGVATAAFISAFPLDRRFGLARGFDTYSDAMPTDSAGRSLNERPGRQTVDEAVAWVRSQTRRMFVWVHLFEPHAPYGDPADPSVRGLSAADRYDREVAEADRQIARLLGALGDRRARTLIIATADHGEAFGEHGEIGHSMFVYDTTLRVPLLMEGPGVAAGRVEQSFDVGLVDIAATIVRRAGLGAMDTDGRDLSAPFLDPRPAGLTQDFPQEQYYAETFAPLLDFGWSPLRSLRAGQWKYIDAPRAELYEIERDRGEGDNRLEREPKEAQFMAGQLKLVSGRGLDTPDTKDAVDPDGRLAALGYVSRSTSSPRTKRADPKDKVKVAAAIARITSGEAKGADLERELRAVLAEDPANPQMNLRYGFLLAETGRCREARGRFDAAIRAKMPTGDAHLGLAGCQASARDFAAALATLREAARIEPGNPIVTANIGLMLAELGRPVEAIDPLREALAAAPGLHQARFGLAVALARLNRHDEAAAAASELLRRLPPDAPQRPEVQRLLASLPRR